jgi:hypothetical protein
VKPPGADRPPDQNGGPTETINQTADQSDQDKVTATVAGFRSDGQPIANFRFAFKRCGQARGWARYQFRALSESGPHHVEVHG